MSLVLWSPGSNLRPLGQLGPCGSSFVWPQKSKICMDAKPSEKIRMEFPKVGVRLILEVHLILETGRYYFFDTINMCDRGRIIIHMQSYDFILRYDKNEVLRLSTFLQQMLNGSINRSFVFPNHTFTIRATLLMGRWVKLAKRDDTQCKKALDTLAFGYQGKYINCQGWCKVIIWNCWDLTSVPQKIRYMPYTV